MITIEHYEAARREHADRPGLRDAAYRESCRREVQAMIACVDAGQWRDCNLCESFTERFVQEVVRARAFVDVGAERGFYTYLALRHMPPGAGVIAFEPDPVRAAALRDLLGGWANLRIHRAAVADAAGSVTLCKPNGCSATAAEVAGERFAVETIALDDYLETEDIDVLKIDVEGAEAAVLMGMERILARRRTTIFLEFHPWVEQVTPGGRGIIRDLLSRNGYAMYRTDRGSPTRVDRPGGRMVIVPD